MMRHTPGPWEIVKHSKGLNIETKNPLAFPAVDEDFPVIESVIICTGRIKDYDADFIVGAENSHDELVEACKNARTEIKFFLNACDHTEIEQSYTSFVEAVEKIEAALDRAKGHNAL